MFIEILIIKLRVLLSSKCYSNSYFGESKENPFGFAENLVEKIHQLIFKTNYLFKITVN